MSRDELLGLIVAVSFAAGLNVYATIATLGLLARADVLTLPGSLDILTSWWVIGTCGALLVLEFVADKIPAFDLVWNALQTFVRPPVGALLAFAASSDFGLGTQLAIAAAGGTIALVAHGGKLAARTAVTPSPEPVSNIALSFLEDATAVFLTWFATRHPILAAAIALTLVAIIVILIRFVIRALRSVLGARSSVLRPGPEA